MSRRLLVAAVLLSGLILCCDALVFRRQSTHALRKQATTTTTATPTDYWITQRLDHFHPLDDRTFQQRFWMNSTFADGNSILFAFAGEAPLQDFYGVSDNFLTQVAQENNMLLVYLEHRFYGHSVPMDDSSEKNLVYLTTDQALEDAVYFLHWATVGNGLPGLAARPKVISFGCSYSGMLSAFFRQKYSWLTVGAIAGSAPVWSVLDFGGYDETMLSVLSNPPNVGCSAIIEKVFDQIVSIYNGPNGTNILREQFNLCTLPRNYSLPELTSALSGYIDVQGNNPDTGFPANVMCQQLLTTTQTLTPLQAYTNYVKSQNPGCLEVDALAGIRVPGADRSWTWQTCTEYGFFQTDTQSQLFGGSVPLSFYLDLCKKAFSLDAPDTSQTNYRFGGLWQNQSSWIIFSNGLQDPWGSNLGVNSPLGPNLNVTLSTSAHCAAYHPPNPNDPPNLVQSRLDILAFVKSALKPRFNQG